MKDLGRLMQGLGLLLMCAGAEAADPFYERLLLDGSAAYQRGDHVSASRDLRLAVFGFLEEPELLARGLVYLGLAQAAMQNADGFRDTYHRLMEVEAGFGGYRKAQLSAEIRAELERQVMALVPESILAASPTFGDLVARKAVEELEAMPVRKRRQALEKKIADAPTEPRWKVMLARTELEDGHEDAALRHAGAVLESNPGHPEALLLHGAALARKKRWPDAVSELEASGLAGQSPGGAAALLRSYSELQRWDEARRFAASLPRELLEADPVKELAQRIPDWKPPGP